MIIHRAPICWLHRAALVHRAVAIGHPRGVTAPALLLWVARGVAGSPPTRNGEPGRALVATRAIRGLAPAPRGPPPGVPRTAPDSHQGSWLPSPNVCRNSSTNALTFGDRKRRWG